MFTIYCQQRKDEEWHHSWKAPFFYLEKFFEQINQGLSRADILKILQQLTSLSIAVLKGAEVNSDTLSEAILCNTTMPDGQVSNRDC